MQYNLRERTVEFVGTGQWVAPSADLIGSVTLSENASVWFNSVLRGDQDTIRIGAGSNIQDGSVLHTDPGIPLVVGDFVTVGHKVMLHGCEIGDQSLIGIGSIILNGAKIGAQSLVGAGSLITEGKEFPPGSLIVGAPAKVVRELTVDERKTLKMAAEHYVDNARRFTTELHPV